MDADAATGDAGRQSSNRSFIKRCSCLLPFVNLFVHKIGFCLSQDRVSRDQSAGELSNNKKWVHGQKWFTSDCLLKTYEQRNEHRDERIPE